MRRRSDVKNTLLCVLNSNVQGVAPAPSGAIWAGKNHNLNTVRKGSSAVLQEHTYESKCVSCSYTLKLNMCIFFFDSAFFKWSFYVKCSLFTSSSLKKGKFKLLTFQILNSDAETHSTKSAYILTLLKLTHLKFDAKIWGQKIQVFGALCKKNNAMVTLIVSCDAKWGALLFWGLSQFSLKQYMTFVLFVVCCL